MLSGACVEREQIIVCAYDRVSYNDLGVGLVASSCGGSRPEHTGEGKEESSSSRGTSL